MKIFFVIFQVTTTSNTNKVADVIQKQCINVIPRQIRVKKQAFLITMIQNVTEFKCKYTGKK